jgi:hypothetical protein
MSRDSSFMGCNCAMAELLAARVARASCRVGKEERRGERGHRKVGGADEV